MLGDLGEDGVRERKLKGVNDAPFTLSRERLTSIDFVHR